jgi:AcrR family transcriptional regulator
VDAKKVSAGEKGQRQRRGIVTRQKLIESARHIFARDGFEHARIEDIAARARKTRGAFYDNFKDKDDVFLAIFEEDMARDLSELGPLLLSFPYTHQRIQALSEYLGKLSEDLERMLLNVEFKLYAIRHPHKRKRLADILRAMRLQTSIPEISRLLPQIDSKTTSANLTDCLAICGVMDGLALNHLFDPDGLDNRTLVRYLQLCLTETIPQLGVGPRSAPGRQCRGSECQQQHRYSGKRKYHRIEGADRKQEGPQEPRCGRGAQQAEEAAHRRKLHPGSQDESQHPRTLTPQRHTQRHFLFAQRNRESNDAVNTKHAQHNGDQRKARNQDGAEAARSLAARDRMLHRLHVVKRQLRVNIMDGRAQGILHLLWFHPRAQQ